MTSTPDLGSLMSRVNAAIVSALLSAPPEESASLTELAHVLIALAVTAIPAPMRLALLASSIPGIEPDVERALEEVRRAYATAAARAPSRGLPS